MSRRAFILGVIAVVAVFLAVAHARREPTSFGSVHDDTLYFSTAKALAEGEGFVMPSVPGAPPQTKYPILYPALLSLAWRLGPEFPANLAWAWWLTALSAGVAIAVWAAVLRQLGAGRGQALGLTALAALNPYVVYWSSTLVSDMLFVALAVGATATAHLALTRRAAGAAFAGWWAAAVALLCLACLARTLGVAFVAGVAATALWRRAWLPAAASLAACLPAALKTVGALGQPEVSASAWQGFQANLLYYTSYTEYWKLCVPDWETLERQVSVTLVEILKYPAIAVFMTPATGLAPMLVQLLAISVSAGIVAGVVKQARRGGLHPLHLAALLYLPIILLWNYPLLTRFGLPFMALLVIGAAAQTAEIGRMLRLTWRRGSSGERVVGTAFALAVAALISYGAYRMVWQIPHVFDRTQQQRAKLSEPKREAYDWIRAHTEPDAVVISYEDGALYLFAGRRGMRPGALSTAAFFRQDQAVLDRDLAVLDHTAAALNAGYWMRAPDDFEQESALEQVRARVDELLADLPVVYASADGGVQVIALSGARWTAAVRPQPLGRLAPQY